MEEAGVYFNLDGLKPDSSDVNSLIDANEMARQEAQGYSNTAKFQGELKGDMLLMGFYMSIFSWCI